MSVPINGPVYFYRITHHPPLTTPTEPLFPQNDNNRTDLHHTPSTLIDNFNSAASASSKMNEMNLDTMDAASGIITPGYGSEDEDAAERMPSSTRPSPGKLFRLLTSRLVWSPARTKTAEDELGEDWPHPGDSADEKIGAGSFDSPDSNAMETTTRLHKACPPLSGTVRLLSLGLSSTTQG